MSQQLNPLRIHLGIARADGSIKPACGRPGAWRFTDRAEMVTCTRCQRIALHPSTPRGLP
jgi:hypothetical protein